MAGIFANIESDISKLNQLKSKIEEVKKSLKKINVKVDIDIAQGLEERLRGLTTQYDALVQKVSQAEGKIIASTQRINQASEKIIKAQEQMAKAASGQGTANTQGVSGGNTAATNAQTASIQAQAKAYAELADEIDAVMGTRSQNIKRMVEEQNAIRIINEELKRMQKLNQTGVYSASETKRIEQLNASLLQHKAALSELRQSLNNSFKLDNAAATSMNALSQSLARMRMTYRELTEEERNSPFGKELLASIQQADAKIKQLDATIGNHQRNVGNYASGWNGLNMSIQQIGRELPSLAMGWNTFFLAISNNLPILTDEIKRAKDEYNALKAAGRQATPVWKQVVSSLLSWQTALTVGITLLTMYGDEIIKWAGNLFKARSSVESLDKQMQNINEKMKSNNAGYGENVVALRSLAEEWSIKDNQAEFNKLGISINDARDAEKAFVTYTDDIIEAFKLRAQAAAASSLAEEKYREALIKRNEADIESAKGPNASDRAKTSFIQNMPTGGGIARMPQISSYEEDAKRAEEIRKKRIQGMYDEAEAAEKAGDSYFKLYEAKKQESDGKLKGLGLGNGLGNEQSISDIESYLNELSRLREENEDRQVELMEEGTDKEVAEIELRYKRMREKVQELEKNLYNAQGGKLTKEQTVMFNIAYTGIDNLQSRDVKKATEDAVKERIQAEREAMNEYLKEYGSYLEKRSAIADEYAQKIAKSGGENTWQGKLLTKERDGLFANLDAEALKTTSAISGLFGDMTDKTLAELERINREGSDALEFLKDGKWDEQKGISFGITKEQFETLSQSPEKLKAISDALNDNRQSADQLRPAYEKIADGLRDVFNAGDDSKKLKEALDDIQDGLNEVMQTAGFLSNTLASLGDSFGSDVLSGISEGINVAMDSINSAMSGAKAGSMFGPIGAAAGAAVGLVGSLASSIAKIHDKKNEKRIQRLQDQIDTLTSSYDKLGRAVEEAYSKDASELIGQQNELLEQQKDLIEQQIREEEDKKKTDEGRIKEWKQQIEEINQAIEDNKEAADNAIFGEDIQSAIENFSSAYAEAWSNGTDKAESAKETVKKMMQQMVTESVKSAIKTSSKMEDIRQKLKQFYADNVLSGWEQDYIYNMAEELQKELDNQFGWADSLFGNDEAKKQQSASSRGFGTEMTHEDAGELSGRFTALNESSLRQESIQQGISNIADEMRSIIANSYLELQQISENTGAIIIPIQKMQKDMEIVKQNTSRL